MQEKTREFSRENEGNPKKGIALLAPRRVGTDGRWQFLMSTSNPP
jgi:hypothetical protein